MYRKYRPRTFADVISQPHIVQTLTNQLKNNQTSHAYLFTGSRGTGKTTCAKILAQAVNCTDLIDGNPCLVCDSCRAIDEGTTDIAEIDAASNNGVDDVRALREEIVYLPVSCKYRVYIIDEVHMLSTSAFNALLKTLEEPPEHVVFILATTESHKVPATVLSRCQRFEFRRIKISDSAERLLQIAEKEGIKLEKSAAELISRLSDGGMRDALSLLDTCFSLSDNGCVTSDAVRNCAGVAGNNHLFELSAAFLNGDCGKALGIVNELHQSSKDMARLIDELVLHYRNLMMLKLSLGDGLSLVTEEEGEYEAFAERLSLAEIMDTLNTLIDFYERISRAKERKTLAEICVIKLCSKTTPQGDNFVKIDTKYTESKEIDNVSLPELLPISQPTPPSVSQPTPPPVSQPTPPPDLQSVPLSADISTVFSQWGEIMNRLPDYISGLLDGCTAFIDENTVILSGNDITKSVIDNKNNYEKILSAITEVTGKQYKLLHRKKANSDVAAEKPESRVDTFIKRLNELNIPISYK